MPLLLPFTSVALQCIPLYGFLPIERAHFEGGGLPSSRPQSGVAGCVGLKYVQAAPGVDQTGLTLPLPPYPCSESIVQAVEGGQITDSMGRKIDFRNAVVIFTTTTTPATAPGPGISGPSAANANASGGGNSSGSNGGGSTSVSVLEQDHVQRHRQDPSHHHHVGSYPGNHFASPSQTSHSAAALSLSLEDREVGGGGSASGSAAQSAPAAGPAGGLPARQVPRLPAELLAAVDAVVALGPLSPDAMRQVAAMQLQACRQLLGEQGVELEVGVF